MESIHEKIARFKHHKLIVSRVCWLCSFAQQPAQTIGTQPPPMVMTAQQDHQRMMELLKITTLRQGADGRNAEAPNAANYDETKANPYPKLPDPLILKNGKKVKTAK